MTKIVPELSVPFCFHLCSNKFKSGSKSHKHFISDAQPRCLSTMIPIKSEWFSPLCIQPIRISKNQVLRSVPAFCINEKILSKKRHTCILSRRRAMEQFGVCAAEWSSPSTEQRSSHAPLDRNGSNHCYNEDILPSHFTQCA